MLPLRSKRAGGGFCLVQSKSLGCGTCGSLTKSPLSSEKSLGEDDGRYGTKRKAIRPRSWRGWKMRPAPWKGPFPIAGRHCGALVTSGRTSARSSRPKACRCRRLRSWRRKPPSRPICSSLGSGPCCTAEPGKPEVGSGERSFWDRHSSQFWSWRLPHDWLSATLISGASSGPGFYHRALLLVAVCVVGCSPKTRQRWLRCRMPIPSPSLVFAKSSPWRSFGLSLE